MKSILKAREDNETRPIFAYNIDKLFISKHYMTKHCEGITTAMSKRTVENQIRNTGLSRVDAARLVLECVEELGERAVGMQRLELLALVRRVLRAGVSAVQAEENTVTFEHAAWASVEARAGRRPTTTRDLRHYVRRMLRVEGVAELPLRGMTTAQCRRILQKAYGHTVHGYRKGRAILHSIFVYGMRQEWCDSNPVARIEVPAVQEHPIQPLSNDEVGRLKEAVAKPEFADMRFSLSMLLYSGVRPAEVERLTPEDVCWEDRQVIIRPQKSKTGGGRVVPLRLLPGVGKRQCRVSLKWQQRWHELRRAAGFTHWVPDVCRHTFASYHAAHFRNLPELQMEMGHRDLSLLRGRYMSPALRKPAAEFWKGMKRR